jgi:uncharacterized Zn finger protein
MSEVEVEVENLKCPSCQQRGVLRRVPNTPILEGDTVVRPDGSEILDRRVVVSCSNCGYDRDVPLPSP